MDHHEVLHLNKIFEMVYEKWFLLLTSKSKRMKRGSNTDDDISTFMSKFCKYHPDEVYELFLGDKATYASVIGMFKNHTIDMIRSEKGKRKIKSTPLYDNTQVFENTKLDHHEFEVNELRLKYKKLVAKRFPKPDYILTFDLITEGYSNEEIIKETGFSSSKVGAIKFRIKNHLQGLNKAS